MKIGKNIRMNRLKLKLTQESLAEKIGVSVQTISSWECDTYQPDLSKLDELAKVYGIEPEDLIKDNTSVSAWSLQDRLFDEEHMHVFIRSTANAKNLKQTSIALPIMDELHAGQFRKGKDSVPYICHPLTMACHTLAIGIDDDDIIATILLHDVVEDCNISTEDLNVNQSIRDAVALLSFSVQPGETKDQAKERYYSAISENRNSSIVKVIDRCNNISCMATGFSKRKMVEYINETDKYILPLLDIIKNRYPEFYNAAFLIRYQILSVTESIKRLL